MTLQQLRVLVGVRAHGSLRACAQALEMSRPRVSQLIQSLETEFGVQLLVRTPQGARLTATGEDLVEGAAPILQLAHCLEERMRDPLAAHTHEVSIQLSVSLPEMAHVTALKLIRQRLGNRPIRVLLFDEPEDDYSEDVHLRLQFGGPPVSGPFRTFLISRVPVCLVASPGYLTKHGHPSTLQELDKHPLLIWSSAAGKASSLPRVDGGWHPVKSALRTTDAPILRHLAAQGDGIALVPCPRQEFTPPWQHLVSILRDQIGATASLRAIIPERLAGLVVTRTLVEVTRELSLLYNAGELVWVRERSVSN